MWLSSAIMLIWNAKVGLDKYLTEMDGKRF